MLKYDYFSTQGGGRRKHRVRDPKGGDLSEPPWDLPPSVCCLISAAPQPALVSPLIPDDCTTLTAGAALDWSRLLTFLRLSSKIKIAPGLFNIGFSSFPLGCLGVGVWTVTCHQARRFYRTEWHQGEQGKDKNSSSVTNLGQVPAIRGSSQPIYEKRESKIHSHFLIKKDTFNRKKGQWGSLFKVSLLQKLQGRSWSVFQEPTVAPGPYPS